MDHFEGHQRTFLGPCPGGLQGVGVRGGDGRGSTCPVDGRCDTTREVCTVLIRTDLDAVVEGVRVRVGARAGVGLAFCRLGRCRGRVQFGSLGAGCVVLFLSYELAAGNGIWRPYGHLTLVLDVRYASSSTANARCAGLSEEDLSFSSTACLDGIDHGQTPTSNSTGERYVHPLNIIITLRSRQLRGFPPVTWVGHLSSRSQRSTPRSDAADKHLSRQALTIGQTGLPVNILTTA